MKKALSLLLALLLLSSAVFSCSHPASPAESAASDTVLQTVPSTDPPETDPPAPERHIYKSVIVLGVDGAGTFNTDTPNLDRIFRDAAYCKKTPTAIPTISAQCWGSLLTGVAPSVHHFTNDSISSGSVHGNKEHPTFFKLVRSAMPDAKLAAFCNWSPIYGGIIENDLGVKTGTGDDEKVTSQVLKYLDGQQPTVMFVQFDSVDHAGHSTGYNNETYYKEIRTVDGYIGKIYDKILEKGYGDDTLLVVTADHGGVGTSHGGLNDLEKYVFFGVWGKSVNANPELSLISRDLPAIVTYALGIDGAENWSSFLPQNLFLDRMTPEARPSDDVITPAETGETPAKGSDGYIGNFVNESSVRLWLPFDGDTAPAIGEISASKNGTVYFVQGVNGQSLRVSSEGTVSLPGLTFGRDSFSIASWVRIESVTGDPPIYSNKDWQDGYKKGFVLCAREIMKFNVGNGSGVRNDFEYAYPSEKTGEWMHTLLVVDRAENKVLYYVNFELVGEDKLNSTMKGLAFDAPGLTFSLGTDGTAKYTSGTLNAEYDDFLVVNGAMTPSDVQNLAKYYRSK